MSDRLRLTPEQGKVFLARLADKNAEQTEAKIAAQLNIGVAAVKKHMNAIYARAGEVFPKITAIESRGKLKELRACLKEDWKRTAQANQSQSLETQRSVEWRDLERQRNLQSNSKPLLKASAPFPRVRWLKNFVERPDALKAVKEKLLAENTQTSVVSVISGMGGLGKSILAMALVQDQEVQSRFEDGLLWVTLGQNPDIQMKLRECIWELDKSSESFSATTKQFASQHLHNLLVEKRILLVVDDAWNAAHVKWFRVGGSSCRVLVTTRTAFIPGAERYSLGLMSLDEALALMQGELGEQWTSVMEKPAREFAELLGYLPLALKLMAVQVARGRKWEMLKKAFLRETERLRSLDYPREKLEALSVDKRREYSLRSCFGMSLQWLEPELLKRFIWLAVLPEDATIQQQMAMTLWNVEDWQAEETLLSLYESSLLTAGLETLEGELTYRVHDLLHLLAQELVEHPQDRELIHNPKSTIENLPGLGLTLAEAQGQFLKRYQNCAADSRWDRLPNDGYIHRHLTWHMEQANWAEEVHTLMAMTDEQGRNAWFEACDRIGHPDIFVQDVATGWRLAEKIYEQEPGRAISLQVRYALTLATLNSIENQIAPELLAALVKHGFWSVERAWVFVESIDDDWRQASALAALIPYLTSPLFKKAIEITEGMVNREGQAKCFVSLAKLQAEFLPKACDAIQRIQGPEEFYKRAMLLSDLSDNYADIFDQALEQAANITDKYLKAVVLIRMLPRDNKLLEEILKLAEELLQGDYDSLSPAEQQLRRNDQAFIFSKIVEYKPSLLNIALTTARQTQYYEGRAAIFTDLMQHDKSLLNETLLAIGSLQGGHLKSVFLNNLSKCDLRFLPDALMAARQIGDEFEQALLLTALIECKPEILNDAVEKSRQVQDTYRRARSLSNLVTQSFEIFEEALTVARRVKDEHMRAAVLVGLSEQTTSDSQRTELLEEALDAASYSEWEHRTGSILRNLSLQKLSKNLFKRIVQLARSIQDPVEKAKTLSALSKHDSSITQEVLELVNLIDSQHPTSEHDEYSSLRRYEQFLLIVGLARQNDELFLQAEEFVQKIEDPSDRALAFCELVKIKPSLCEQALEATSQIQALFARADALGSLFWYCPDSLLPKVWNAIDSITSHCYRARAYSSTLEYFSSGSTSFSKWNSLLHVLASRKRSELLQDLATLYPVILHLGGEAAIDGVVDAMRQVCNQWK